MTDYGEMPTPPRKPEPPPRKCANCVFKNDDDGLCYRRGFSTAEAKAAASVPRPCFPDNSCFHHQYRQQYRQLQGLHQ